ncbi:hypothetical protein L0F63_002782, partial [Massospora cicadina]
LPHNPPKNRLPVTPRHKRRSCIVVAPKTPEYPPALDQMATLAPSSPKLVNHSQESEAVFL